MINPFTAGLIAALALSVPAGRLTFNPRETSIDNVTSPIPTRRYMARLRRAALQPGRRPK